MQRFATGAVTDVFSPDITVAAAKMREFGMRGAELRTVGAHHVLEAGPEDVEAALKTLLAHDLEVVAIVSPLLKCPLDEFPDQSKLVERAFDVAAMTGAKIIRVFSGLRAAEPGKCFERVVDLLQDLADKAARRNLIIGLENDRACNIATAQETAGILAAIDHTNLQIIWDPASAYISGEKPFPSGYQMLDVTRLALVHAKDCTLEGHKPVWEPLGEGDIDWQGQVDALADDHYTGPIHLETYGQGAEDSARNLQRLVAASAL
jgi:sugar phosphate isomerase/epimerase